jgi:hypothetical protein
VNIYRLIKVGLPDEDQSAFTRDRDDQAGDYQMVLFLLAVATGTPDIWRPFFERLIELSGKRGDGNVEPLDLAELVRVPSTSKESAGASALHWKRLEQCLAETSKTLGSPLVLTDLPRLIQYASLVSRYSFRVEQN